MAVACAAALGLWRWSQGTGLPPVPPEADQWYRRGTEALRDGAFQSARLALDHAVAISPQHALAYARLAEADAELDDERAAQTHLLRLSSLVPDESRLSADDQLRVRAVRDSLLRNVDNVVAANQALVNRHPHDAGAWVDLGRRRRPPDCATTPAPRSARDREDARNLRPHTFNSDPSRARRSNSTRRSKRSPPPSACIMRRRTPRGKPRRSFGAGRCWTRLATTSGAPGSTSSALPASRLPPRAPRSTCGRR